MQKYAVVVCLFLLTLGAFAQSDRGAITGAISDPSGAVVANAKIEAKNVDTGATYEVGSSTTGNYVISQLPSGKYELAVTVSGFKKYVRQNLEVPVATTVRQDVKLEVGATSDVITISDTTPLLKTEGGDVSHNITYDRVNNLPLLTLTGGGTGLGNIRNPLAVVTLLPGASFSGDNTLRINGLPSSSQAIRIEGQDATNGMWRQITQINQSGVDAIQEVSIQTSNFAAEFGQAGGGYFNYTMKSGTNQFHGSAYDYVNDDVFNAGTPFTDDGNGGHIKNALHRNDYGFTLGGPILIPKVYDGHDKTFFFFNFEQFRESTTTATSIATVPTAAYRAGSFASATLPFFPPIGPDPLGRFFPVNQVFDPSTQRSAPDGRLVRDPFAGDQIPLTQFDTVAQKVQKLIPNPLGPNANSPINNYAIPAFDNFRHTTIPSIKIDHSLSSSIKISGYFSQTHTVSPNSIGLDPSLAPVAPQDDTSRTVRLNYDQTLTPTLLLHLGAGLLHTYRPLISPPYDQGQLWAPNQRFAADLMPSIGNLNNFFTGGVSLGTGFFAPGIGAGAFNDILLTDIKPTGNASLTWVKGNHTYKLGGELVVEGFPQQSMSRANGIINFAASETANPWENGVTSFPFTSGFPYASFFLGRTDNVQLSAITDSRLGSHALGLFIQDTWKVTRKFTLDYGLRWDYQTLLKEQYGRMQNASFATPNVAAGGRLGAVIYEGDGGGRCNCRFQNNYPYAIGPRIGVAYQINSKTVFRAGSALSYGTSANNAFLSYSVPDFYTVSPRGFGDKATQLSQGNPYAPNNVFGNPPTIWPDFSPHYPTQVAPGVIPPQSPFISIDRNAGRPGRIFQWSFGLQRELTKSIVVEASYVGNRGVWWTAPTLATQNYNALQLSDLPKFGLNPNNPADLALLTTPINSPAVLARFPQFANPNAVYAGFPNTQNLNQALSPYPQWGRGVPPFLGPPLGSTWYDSLQAKVTKRYSHGLDVAGAFTWQKELVNGTNSDTGFFTPGTVLINDAFNHDSLKQVSALSRPLMLVISFTYTTPRFKADSAGLKAVSWLARDWALGGVLRYQSGAVIATPPSLNNLLTQLGRGPENNPAIFGGGNTFWNRNPNQPLFLNGIDPNCHCFDPTKQLVLNPAAWTDAAPGQFGASAPYYNNYRWQRQPAESLSFGRIFRIKEKYQFQMRAEFTNVFNRVFLSAPAIGGFGGATPATPAANGNPGGALSGGYGFINTLNGIGTQPRTGQLVGRFTF